MSSPRRRRRIVHVVLSLITISDFKYRITQPDVRFIELQKPPGHAVPLYPRIVQLLRDFKADVVLSCNLGALEITPLAWLARVPLRIHAEHGWDAHDPAGQNLRYQRLRKLPKPFVSHYVAVSKDLDECLTNAIGMPGTPDVVEDSVTGLLVPSVGTNAMAQALWSLYTDAARVCSFAQSARRRALKNFGMDAMVRSCERLFFGQQRGESGRSVPGYFG